jgi:hypothetical protein
LKLIFQMRARSRDGYTGPHPPQQSGRLLVTLSMTSALWSNSAGRSAAEIISRTESRATKMPKNDGFKLLKAALVAVGVIFVIGIYPLTIVWPAGWTWHSAGHSDYLQMILGVYATLGIFLILAARHPLQNLSLIWFTVWSSIVHGGIMAMQAFAYPEHRGHLLGDVPALLIVAIVLAILTIRAQAQSRLAPVS